MNHILKLIWATDYSIVTGYPLIVGFCTALIIGLAAYVIGNTRRHQCKEDGCGCKTKTCYRMIRLHNIPITKSGLVTYAVFKFRFCCHYHVSVSIKTKLFTSSQINSKPKTEFDWKSDFIINLCAKAGIANPETDYLLAQLKNPNAVPRLVVVDTKVSNYWPAPHAIQKK